MVLYYTLIKLFESDLQVGTPTRVTQAVAGKMFVLQGFAEAVVEQASGQGF